MGYIIIYANASNSIIRVEISKYLNNEQITTYIDSTLIAHEGLAKRSIPKNQEQLNSECKHFVYECKDGLSALYFIDEIRDLFSYVLPSASAGSNNETIYILEPLK